MAKDRMGHKPELVISKNSIQKWERCQVCGDSRVRGKRGRWPRVCPGPAQPKSYMGGA